MEAYLKLLLDQPGKNVRIKKLKWHANKRRNNAERKAIFDNLIMTLSLMGIKHTVAAETHYTLRIGD